LSTLPTKQYSQKKGSENRIPRAKSSCLSRTRGSSIVETAAGLLVLVPVVLFLLDLVALVLVQTANDSLAKHAARAAAERADAASAGIAAQQVVDAYPSSTMLTNPHIDGAGGFVYTNIPGTSQVYVRTVVTCKLPIAVPLIGISEVDFKAEATEPIVAVLPP